jgi:hypothetical protein
VAVSVCGFPASARLGGVRAKKVTHRALPPPATIVDHEPGGLASSLLCSLCLSTALSADLAGRDLGGMGSYVLRTMSRHELSRLRSAHFPHPRCSLSPVSQRASSKRIQRSWHGSVKSAILPFASGLHGGLWRSWRQ